MITDLIFLTLLLIKNLKPKLNLSIQYLQKVLTNRLNVIQINIH
jgi:hypothetical protein